jgi:hypothetical protein
LELTSRLVAAVTKVLPPDTLTTAFSCEQTVELLALLKWRLSLE